MNKFEKIYLNLLYEQKGNLTFNLEKYFTFLKNATKIDKNFNIIEEEKTSLIDIPINLINFLLKNSNSFINENDFKNMFQESKHWQNLKNIHFNKIFFGLFDFLKNEDIDRFHYNCFEIEQKDFEKVRNNFKEFAGGCFGFFNSYDNIDIICINKQSTDIFQTVYHELSHYVQKNGNIRIVNGITIDKIKNKNQLKQIFGVEYEKIISYFSDKEFIPHVDDLITKLKITKENTYKSISNFDFLNKLKDFLLIKNKKEMITNEFFIAFKNDNHGNFDSLAMLLFSYLSKYKFQKIFDIIKIHFQ